ncbi:protein of unknown function [Hyphomicrobium sp. MC1]|nr:protein of unknown function [Hyphomicrobium sp. MC1]
MRYTDLLTSSYADADALIFQRVFFMSGKEGRTFFALGCLGRTLAERGGRHNVDHEPQRCLW